MRMQFVPLFAPILSAGVAVSLQASNDTVAQPQDRIAVVGHLPWPGVEVDCLSATLHYSRNYLYAEDTKLGKVTVIDVTDVKAPSVVQVARPANAQSSDLLAVTGTAALIGSPALPSAEPAPQSVRIVSFADPGHPQIPREFTGVTTVGSDSGRGLVFLANPEGIWILSKQPAEDPAVAMAYQDHVTYALRNPTKVSHVTNR